MGWTAGVPLGPSGPPHDVVGVTGSLDAGVHVNTSAESPYRSLRRLGVSEVLDRLRVAHLLPRAEAADGDADLPSEYSHVRTESLFVSPGPGRAVRFIQ